MSDYLDFADVSREDWERLLAKPPVEIEDGNIVIRPNGPDGFKYTILAERIDTSAKCLVWVLHIGKKKWSTPKILDRIVALSQSIHGFSIPWGC